MSDTASTSLGWICPACTRHVPERIDRCRCGQERVSTKPAAPPSDILVTARPTWSRTIIEGVFVCLVVAGCAYYYINGGASSAASGSTTTIAHANQPNEVRDPQRAARVATPALADRTAAHEQAVAREPAPDRPEPSAAPLEDMIEHAMPAVVLVEATKTRGSGFLVRPGLIVTNAHVAAGAPSVTVTLQDGQHVSGTILQSSEEFDLALVSIARE